jgi:hypothetical protein
MTTGYSAKAKRRSDLFAAWVANRRAREFWLAVLEAVDPTS